MVLKMLAVLKSVMNGQKTEQMYGWKDREMSRKQYANSNFIFKIGHTGGNYIWLQGAVFCRLVQF